MKGSRFSEEQIIGILREHEAGGKTPDLCRRHGISDATFYKWKAKYGGLEVSEARRLKSLEDENRRLKKLLAEAMLDKGEVSEGIGDVVAGKTPLQPRRVVVVGVVEDLVGRKRRILVRLRERNSGDVSRRNIAA